MPSSAEQLTLETRGLETAALAWGDPDAPPVLGLHGWLDNAATMAKVAPRIDGRRFVSLDLPGHGLSEHRGRGESYLFVDLVPAIFDAADALGWEHFSIVAHSMGAAASCLVAGARPSRVDEMVLVDGLGPWSTPPDQTAEQLEKGLEERATLADKTKRRFDEPEAAVSVVAEMYGLPEDVVRPMVERGLEETPDGGVQFTYDLQLRGSSLVRFTEPQVLDCLERIEARCLLVRPTNGWPVEGDLFERRIEAVDDLTVREIEGSHHVHLERPGAVADAANQFFE